MPLPKIARARVLFFGNSFDAELVRLLWAESQGSRVLACGGTFVRDIADDDFARLVHTMSCGDCPRSGCGYKQQPDEKMLQSCVGRVVGMDY